MEKGTVSRRTFKLGKAFQNWRRAQLKFLQEMHRKKMYFMAWCREAKGERDELCMEDLLWTEDDMDHLLHTVASFETHKHLWKERRVER